MSENKPNDSLSPQEAQLGQSQDKKKAKKEKKKLQPAN